MEVLQEIDFSEEVDTIEISVSFIIRSESLPLESLSKELGLNPTRSWNKGEEYIGKQFNPIIKKAEQIQKKRLFSIWEIDSSNFVSSKKVEAHIDYMVDLLISKKNIINGLLNEKDYFIKVNILKKSNAEVIDYQVNPKLLTELISLCKNVSFSNYFVSSDNKDDEES
jgi:hypothetical protein